MTEPLGAAREVLLPADPGETFGRVNAIIDMMVARQWERGSDRDLAEHWGAGLSTVQNYSAEASRFLLRVGDTDALLELVRVNAVRWIAEGDKDRVASARLLVDMIGGITQKHSVEHKAWEPSDPVELVRHACKGDKFRMAIGQVVKELGYESFGLPPQPTAVDTTGRDNGPAQLAGGKKQRRRNRDK